MHARAPCIIELIGLAERCSSSPSGNNGTGVSLHRAAAAQETQRGWGYQCCTEVYQPMPTDGKTDFLLPSTPNETDYFANCARDWGVAPRPTYEERHFWGANIAAGSNIFLASGQLDPWRAAGIQAAPKGAPDSIVVRIVEGGAHHLDLRASHAADPPSVTKVREEEKAAMHQWVAEWKAIMHG